MRRKRAESDLPLGMAAVIFDDGREIMGIGLGADEGSGVGAGGKEHPGRKEGRNGDKDKVGLRLAQSGIISDAKGAGMAFEDEVHENDLIGIGAYGTGCLAGVLCKVDRVAVSFQVALPELAEFGFALDNQDMQQTLTLLRLSKIEIK